MSSTKVYKTPRKRSGIGSYGAYYVLDSKKKIGLKVIGEYESSKYWEHKISSELLGYYQGGMSFGNGGYAGEPAHELAALFMLRSLYYVPNGYGLVWVKQDNKYAIGILMEHINGECIGGDSHNCHLLKDEDEDEANDVVDYFRSEVESEMEDTGIIPDDWHPWNVMVTARGKKYRIDFTPQFYSVTDNVKKKYNKAVDNAVLELIGSFPG